ncbi:MAG: DUF2085 domain-containing protein [candidate division Zixibacteria bacterium]|nr:DUF2085 domain-containing protein [candidate division Zixibacteria bacterium]
MIEKLLGEICHQLPARSLAVAGVTMPVCARCAGIYLGILLACAFYAVPGRYRVFMSYPSRGAAALAAVAVLPCVADYALARIGSPLAVGNGARFVISLFAGWGAWVLLAGLATGLRWGFVEERRLGFGELVGSLAALLVPGLLIATPYALAGRILAGGILAGAIATYGLLNYLPLALLLPKRRFGLIIRAIIMIGLIWLAVVEIKWGYVTYEALENVFT